MIQLRVLAGPVILCFAVLFALPTVARAAEPPVALSLHAIAMPTTIAPEGEGNAVLLGTNIGAARTSSTEPIQVSDTLPEGIEFVETGIETRAWSEEENFEPPTCTASGQEVICSVPDSLAGEADGGFSIDLVVKAAPVAAQGVSLLNRAELSGGGTLTPVLATNPLRVTSTPTRFGIASFAFEPSEGDGNALTRAGGHPDLLTLGFDLNTVPQYTGHNPMLPTTATLPKDVVVELPLGFLGNPQASDVCSQALTIAANGTGCPPASVIGVPVWATRATGPGYTSASGSATALSYLHNTAPEFGFPAEFGLGTNNIPAAIYSQVAHTPAGYVLRTISANIPRAATLKGIFVNSFGDPNARNGIEPHIPFFTMPADCQAQGLAATIHVDSWEDPAPMPLKPDGSNDFEAADFSDPQWANQSLDFPTPTGCNQLEFKPSKFEARPTTNVADSPSGLDVNLEIPQPEEMETPSTPPLKDAVVTLPQGLVVDPSSADGLEGCAGAQIALDSTRPGSCPDGSKLGTVELQTPLLGERDEAGAPSGPRTLHGAMYLGTPECAPCGNADAEAGKLVKLYLEIDDPQTGVVIKVPGTASLDPRSGQVKAVFDQQPQLPFSDLKVHLFEGDRGSLTTPPTCGVVDSEGKEEAFSSISELTPWSAPESGPPATPSDSYRMASAPGGGPCLRTEAEEPNNPHFEAGSQSTQAGAFSPFVLKLSREDGTQRLTNLNVTLPPGLTGKLAGVGECPDAAIEAAKQTSAAQQILSPSCPLSSEVGTVDVAAGSGPTPFHVAGHAYLSGPYKGAPLSMAIVTPAKAGPFDLGTVVVRAALHLNPETAQITVRSDPIPTILAGIPLDLRQISVNVSRNNFTLNPTNCERMTVSGEAISTLGQTASLTNPFQVGGCKSLKFAPKLSLSLKGKTNRGAHPALKAVLRMKPGEANIARAQVTLPHAEFLDQGHLNNICTRVQFSEGNVPGESCPAASIYGHAKAITPLLDQPLEGNVYLRSSSHKLPDLVAALNGQINIALDGKVDTGRTGGIRNTFEVVPDAPVSKFVLEMKGGRKGLLVNSENLCSPRAKTHAIAHFVGQNGKVDNFNPAVANSCPKAHKKHRGKR